MKKILILLISLVVAGCTRPEPVEPPHWSAVELLRRQHEKAGELSPWAKFQLAIIWTESKANPAAIGKDNDGGLYQMIPVYVEEVNRVCGTNYTHEDVFDPDKAIEIFNAMQGYYNPDKDIEEALRHHNRSSAYRAAVLRNLEIVERMEIVRSKLIEYGE